MDEYPNSVGGVAVVFFKTIASTNAEALARANAGENGPLWFVAERQSAGRGRRGREWFSEPGNLHASLLLIDPAPAAATAGICFVAALALHDAVLDAAQDLSPARLKLKWPNDLLLDAAKLAGILVEGITLAHGRAAVAVGFGVNCRAHPEAADFPAIDLAAAGLAVPPGALLKALGERCVTRLREWDRGLGFSAVRSAWLARAAGIGGAILVRLADRSIGGIFEAVDATGGLVLKRSDGKRETINAGDVFPIGG
jgi:BirA family biotin operon repressor/biotin-[acetyl-CoA-carboxylase] ligase